MYKQTTIPIFPEFKPLRLEDRGIIHPLFWQLQSEIDDRCFTNIYMWQDFYNIQISRHNGNICFFSASDTTPEKEFFFPPIGDNGILDTVEACLNFLQKRGNMPIIRRASEVFIKNHLKEQTKFLVRQNVDTFDYIYNHEDLANLQGRHYHGQRNFIKQFKKNYPDFSIELLSRENISECQEFCKKWLQTKVKNLSEKLNFDPDFPPETVVFLRAETEGTQKILRHFEYLGLTGLAIRINGRIRAFTIGEKMNDKMALIHIEKADYNYRGLIQYLNQAFCQVAWSDCKYINRMEDLGVDYLRKAKLALKPHHMAKKYEIVYK